MDRQSLVIIVVKSASGQQRRMFFAVPENQRQEMEVAIRQQIESSASAGQAIPELCRQAKQVAEKYCGQEIKH